MRKRVPPERVVLVLIAAVALAGLVVSPALGGPGFLTKKKAGKIFLTKKAAKRLYLSKGAADARFYPRTEADARFLRPEGEIRITSGPTNWVIGSTTAGDDPTIAYFADSARVRSEDETTVFAEMMPDLPATLYGRATKVSGAELCYNAASNAKILLVSFDVITESTGIDAVPPINTLALDGAVRTDNTCRAYKAATPVALGPGDFVTLSVLIEYPNKVVADILLGRASIILQP